MLNLATLIALAGVVIAGVLTWLHAQLEHAGADYTSFCNINSRINCDLVLTSPFAKLWGVPIAWLALGAYGGLAVIYQAAARTSGRTARRALQLACAGTIGAAAFAAYMAFISFTLLQTACLMCMGLYIVTAALLWIALLLPSRYAGARKDEVTPPLTVRGMSMLGLLAVFAVAGLAGAAWYVPSSRLPADPTLEQLRQADPEFYDWYVALRAGPSPDDGGHVFGNETAPVTIVEFSDFECGYCARNHVILKELIERRPTLVRVVYRHFPLDAACNEALEQSVHSRACRAAEAAECAAMQGRFEKMADALFANQQRLFEANLYTLAAGAGVDVEQFRRCMTEHTALAAVISDSRAGRRLELESTPTLFINGRRVVGTLKDVDHYEHAVLIESRLATAKATETKS